MDRQFSKDIKDRDNRLLQTAIDQQRNPGFPGSVIIDSSRSDSAVCQAAKAVPKRQRAPSARPKCLHSSSPAALELWLRN